MEKKRRQREINEAKWGNNGKKKKEKGTKERDIKATGIIAVTTKTT